MDDKEEIMPRGVYERKHNQIVHNPINRVWEKYIDSGIWKCSKSPTGTHHFIFEEKKGTCKYCGEIREGTPYYINRWGSKIPI